MDLGTINNSAGKFSSINAHINTVDIRKNSINKSHANLLVVYINFIIINRKILVSKS